MFCWFVGVSRRVIAASARSSVLAKGHMITTKAVMNSLLEHATGVESLAVLSRFRVDFRRCLAPRGDELFELADGAPRGTDVPDGGE